LAESIETKLGLKCRAYHAGIDTDIRRQLQQDWLDGELPLVAATNAFGMGIDKDDCRYVIHYEMPYSLESYYQEAGRAGRDGRESYAVLLYNPSDGVKAEKRIRDSYPRKQQLQKTYDALCDTLNLAVGSEMDRAEQVPLEAVRKRSGLPLRKVRAGLKLLDRMGVIQLMEYVKPMIGIYFQVSEDFVRRQVQTLDNEKKSFFLDTLFRQFGQRAFEEMTYRDLDYLKHKLDTTSNGVIKGLQVLQNHDHLLRYESTGEMPLVRLLDERVARLQFTRAELEKHRDNLLRKVEYMIGYIQTDRCREEYIRRYFGEQEVEPCGHCDNCMDIHEEPAEAISSSEIDTLKGVLSESPKSISEIKALTNWNSRKIKQSLSFLIREQRVETESDKYQWKE
ncbi:MAG: helicase-related protein, partial [Balneolaceae bacterium]|nr:helicase-related protein [Balneolaceae bacterium]